MEAVHLNRRDGDDEAVRGVRHRGEGRDPSARRDPAGKQIGQSRPYPIACQVVKPFPRRPNRASCQYFRYDTATQGK
jgi:hypothetical protein